MVGALQTGHRAASRRVLPLHRLKCKRTSEAGVMVIGAFPQEDSIESRAAAARIPPGGHLGKEPGLYRVPCRGAPTSTRR
jgi:hypothetical protein